MAAMTERIRDYLDALFSDVTETQKLRDFKEELTANLCEKIRDLRAAGLGDDRAFREAIATLGDIHSVFMQNEDLRGESDAQPTSPADARIDAPGRREEPSRSRNGSSRPREGSGDLREGQEGPWKAPSGPWKGPWGPWNGSWGPWSKSRPFLKEEERTGILGALFLLTLVIYLYLGFNHIGRGFGLIWVLSLAYLGLCQLFRRRFTYGLLLIAVSALTYLKSVGFWNSVLLLTAALAAGRVLSGIVGKPHEEA